LQELTSDGLRELHHRTATPPVASNERG